MIPFIFCSHSIPDNASWWASEEEIDCGLVPRKLHTVDSVGAN